LDWIVERTDDADWHERYMQIVWGNPAEGTSKEDLMGWCHKRIWTFWPIWWYSGCTGNLH